MTYRKLFYQVSAVFEIVLLGVQSEASAKNPYVYLLCYRSLKKTLPSLGRETKAGHLFAANESFVFTLVNGQADKLHNV